jgi:hypothetical protein
LAVRWKRSCTASACSIARDRTPWKTFEGSGADFLEIYKPYILDGETIIASPHKVYGPETNDLALQLRKKGVSQIILAGMAANLCVESHLRELLEQGFEIVVVRDATAGPRLPDGDGYLAAIINYRFSPTGCGPPKRLSRNCNRLDRARAAGHRAPPLFLENPR